MSQPGFWARRKAAVAAEARDEVALDAALSAGPGAAAQPEPDMAAPAEARPDDIRSDAEVLETLGLPDPDTLGAGDDFSGFMAQAVPRHLRNRALRRLWISNPVLANVDGLLDYADDFTDAACVLPDMQTAYQVGKGMTRHVEALLAAEAQDEAEDEAAEDVSAQEPDAAPPPSEVPLADAASPIVDLHPVEDGASLAHEQAPATPDPAAPPRRHMRFEFS